MSKKFQPLDYSRGWDDYWRDHPQGYSPQEQMINWSGQLNAMIDFFNEYFDVDLTEYATGVMEEWYFDGRLDEIINEALFDSKADKTTVNSLIDTVEYMDSKMNDIAINVKMFGAKGDGVTDDTEAIRTAIDIAYDTCGVVIFPRGKYRITDTITLNDNGITLTGVICPTSNDNFEKSSEIIYDGEPGKNIFVIGSETTVKSVNPIRFEKLLINGQGKNKFAIYSNRANIQSKIEDNFFRDCVGFLKLENCYYMTVTQNVFRNYSLEEIGGNIPLAAWEEVKDGLVQLNVANNVIFEKNSFHRIYMTYNGELPTNLIKTNRQESCHINMTTIENVKVTYLINIGQTSSGNNLQISHTYLEQVDARAFLQILGYALSDIEVNHVHVYGCNFNFLYRCGANTYKNTVKSSFIEFRSNVSVGQLIYNYLNSASFSFENCFFGVGEWVFGSGELIIEPFDGIGERYDNRMGIDFQARDRAAPITGSFVEGFTTEYGADDKGPFLLVTMDCDYSNIRGKNFRLTKSEGAGIMKQRLRPTSDGVYWLTISIFQTLLLIPDENITQHNYAAGTTPLCKITVTNNVISEFDESVRRPKGLYVEKNAALIVRDSNPNTEDTTWNKGDYAQNINPVELGATGSKYIVRGWMCVVGGRGVNSQWVEDRGVTGN